MNQYTFDIDLAQNIYIFGKDKFDGNVQIIIYDSEHNYVTEYNGNKTEAIYLENPGTYYLEVSDNIGGTFKVDYENSSSNISEELETMIVLYTTYFDRAADKPRVDYCMDVMSKEGYSFEEVAKIFSQLPDCQDLYKGFNQTQIISEVYSNVLNRSATEVEISYWNNEINSGNLEISLLIKSLIDKTLEKDSSGNYINSEDAVLFNNKIVFSKYFYGLNIDNTTISLDSITADSSSVRVLKSQIDYLILDSIDIDSYSIVNDGSETIFNNSLIKTLDSGNYWDTNTLTFSFNEMIPDDYYDSEEYVDGFTPLSNQQRESVRDIFEKLSEFTNLEFQEVSLDGVIRFNITDFVQDDLSDAAAYAYYPGDFPYSSDLFLSKEYFSVDTNPGDFTYHTISHELGHALGLEHPFEGDNILDVNLDDVQHTIMSYTSPNTYNLIFSNDNEYSYGKSIENYPAYYSIYDIAALQLQYGSNLNSNTENNIYKFSYKDSPYETIWDAGGIDTLDLSNNLGNTTLDLNGGSLNSIDQYTLDMIVEKYQNDFSNIDSTFIKESVETTYNSDLLYTGENNIGIAYGTIIENVFTGMGNDIVIDNQVDNVIDTSAGDDYIYLGNGGLDTVNGGFGTDYVSFSYYESEMSIILNNDKYLVFNDNYMAILNNVEYIKFEDSLTYENIDLFV
jgi:hypothetical protein